MVKQTSVKHLLYLAAGIEEFGRFVTDITNTALENLKLAAQTGQEIRDAKIAKPKTPYLQPQETMELSKLAQAAATQLEGLLNGLKVHSSSNTTQIKSHTGSLIVGYRMAGDMYSTLQNLTHSWDSQGRLADIIFSDTRRSGKAVLIEKLGELAGLYNNHAGLLEDEIKKSRLLLRADFYVDQELAEKVGPYFVRRKIEKALKKGLLVTKIKDTDIRAELQKMLENKNYGAYEKHIPRE